MLGCYFLIIHSNCFVVIVGTCGKFWPLWCWGVCGVMVLVCCVCVVLCCVVVVLGC